MVFSNPTDMQAAAAAGVADRVMVFKSGSALGSGVSQAAALRASSSSSGGAGAGGMEASSGGAGVAGAGVAGVKTLTPLFIDALEDDPSDTLPPGALPVVLYANLEEAVDAMLSRASLPSPSRR